MRVLVLGSGAKDHAIVRWFSRSSLISALYVAPGNYCTGNIAVNLPLVDPAVPESVYDACCLYNIDFVFIGTEAPLFTGVVEYLEHRGIEVFGAPSESIKLEGNKSFSRAFTSRHNIPVPRNSLFTDLESLEKYLRRHNGDHFIIKSNSITPSRVMLDSSDVGALVEYAEKLFLRGPVLLEEYIPGIPVTVTLLLDKNGYLTLPFVSEYTRVNKENKTPTGGMGAICPVPLAFDVEERIREEIIKPTLYGLKCERLAYKGVLTLSIKIRHEDHSPVLVDYHVRFNDPATQTMVPIIKSDIVAIMSAMKEDRVSEFELDTEDGCTVAVVLASPGYPTKPETGKIVKGLTNAFLGEYDDKPIVFCGAIQKNKNDEAVTTGGRNLTVVGKGSTIEEANKKAYALIKGKRFENLWYREDIGNEYFRL